MPGYTTCLMTRDSLFTDQKISEKIFTLKSSAKTYKLKKFSESYYPGIDPAALLYFRQKSRQKTQTEDRPSSKQEPA